jgi:hypothetical protein
VPDALASAAQQLVNKGWQPGVRWAYEVKAPANADCTLGVPEVTRPIGEWLRAGFVPVRGQQLSAAEQAQPASLLQPEGIYGPAFLTTKNYFVIKEYNFSDLYVLYVGHLSDRMISASAHAPWSVFRQARRQGGDADARSTWRLSEIGRAQGGLLAERSSVAFDERGTLKKKNPADGSAGLKIEAWRVGAVPVRSVADLDAAEAPVITIPEALANETAARGRTFHIHRRSAIIIGRGRAGGDSSADNGATNQSASNGSTEAALRARGCSGERSCDRCSRDEGNK